MKNYEKRMTIDEERKYLHKMRLRYWEAKRKSKRSQLLDEMEEVTGNIAKASFVCSTETWIARNAKENEGAPMEPKCKIA